MATQGYGKGTAYLFVLGGLGGSFLFIVGLIMIGLAMTIERDYVSVVERSGISSIILGLVLACVGSILLTLVFAVRIFYRCRGNDAPDAHRILAKQNSESVRRNPATERNRQSANREEKLEMKKMKYESVTDEVAIA
ncbi:Uncharacterised protein g5657 [Pycnogonum litorale]